VVCINDEEEHVSIIAEVFTLQAVTFTLRGIMSEMTVYSDMPSSYTMDNVAAKFVLKTSGNEKLQAILMLTELADSMILPPYVVINRTTSETASYGTNNLVSK
jgi:hypothetical protein